MPRRGRNMVPFAAANQYSCLPNRYFLTISKPDVIGTGRHIEIKRRCKQAIISSSESQIMAGGPRDEPASADGHSGAFPASVAPPPPVRALRSGKKPL